LTSITIPDGVTSFGEGAFDGCSGLTDVYYGGTKAQWEKIEIDNTEGRNDPLLNATIHYRGETNASLVLTDGVKYVPYSGTGDIRTYIGDNFTVSPYQYGYSLIEGTLPGGMTLDSAGVIRGVPTSSGKYSFKVQFQDEEHPETSPVTIDCTLTILDNTDDNVWNYTSEGCSIITPVGVNTTGHHYVLKGFDDVTFVCNGHFEELGWAQLELYLDGLQLVQDKDYTAQSGGNDFPNRVTIQINRSFLESAGTGAHTLAVYYYGSVIDGPTGEDNWLGVTAQNFTIEADQKQLTSGVKYVPYSYTVKSIIDAEGIERIQYTLPAGTLPSGLTLNGETGEIAGVPMANGTFTFTVRQDYVGVIDGIEYSGGGSQAYTLVIETNSNQAVQRPNDYEITEPIGTPDPGSPNSFLLDSYRDETLVINGPYQEFMRLLIDGRELTRDRDYTAREGSTVITILAQTFEKYGEGTHTVAAEFREGGKKDGKLKTVSQNYTVKLRQTNPGGGSSGSSSGGTSSKPKPSKPSKPTTPTTPTPPVTPTPPAMPFSDVAPGSWYYDDVKWVYDGQIMTGVTATAFAPETNISQATIVTVLARVAGVDLTQFSGAADSVIESGKYYSEAAIWAKQSGLLPDYSTFTGEETISRDQMAIMLVKYLRSMGKDTTPPAQAVTFADASLMSADGNNAFQVLYQRNIFRGIGEGRMDPGGFTTRAQFAALVRRVSDSAQA